MMDIKEIGTGMWYRAQNPATLARRLYGRSVTVREERQSVYRPTYRIWAAVDRFGNVYGRLYTDDASWTGEYDDYPDSSRRSRSSGRPAKASGKTKSTKGRGSCNTKSRSKAASQPRKANGQFAKKPRSASKSKGVRR